VHFDPLTLLPCSVNSPWYATVSCARQNWMDRNDRT